MANILKDDKRAVVVAALAEGSAIRAIERQTGIHRDTIMRLGVQVGTECQRLLSDKMQGLESRALELDEIWGFIQKKQKNVTEKDGVIQVGDVWTFVAIDADTKVVPCYRVGKRDAETANAFLIDLSERLKNRVQLSTDALKAYVEAVEKGFGGEVDYGQIVKSYSVGKTDDTAGGSQRKYSPPEVVGVSKKILVGNPDKARISTSYVERQNLTMRMHIRRLTRLTNAFSKKIENFKAAVALHFAYYNFVLIHSSLDATPAMAAGVASSPWTVRELVERAT